jgi:hypothetical protein
MSGWGTTRPSSRIRLQFATVFRWGSTGWWRFVGTVAASSPVVVVVVVVVAVVVAAVSVAVPVFPVHRRWWIRRWFVSWSGLNSLCMLLRKTDDFRRGTRNAGTLALWWHVGGSPASTAHRWSTQR